MSRLESALYFRAFWEQCFFTRGGRGAWEMYLYYHDKAVALMTTT